MRCEFDGDDGDDGYEPIRFGGACGIAMAIDIAGRPSREIVLSGLEALERLTHRGACAGRSALIDGAGVMVEIPWAIFDAETSAAGDRAPDIRALLALFSPEASLADVRRLVSDVARTEGFRVGGTRQVPVVADALDATLRADAPALLHFELITSGRNQSQLARVLFRLKLRLRTEVTRRGLAGVTVVSLSTKTTVYKALATPEALPRYYPDLTDPRMQSAVIVGHQRFATNVLARWDLAQPFGLIAHNGEINTVTGNRLAFRSRLTGTTVRGRSAFDPADAISTNTSDSSSLDDAAGALVASGLSLAHAMSRLIPPGWEQDQALAPDVRAFHAYQALCGEPWEGPAAMAFSDGSIGGALVDKSGFRPLRWMQTADGRVLVGSEAGLFDVADADVLTKSRVGPGDKVIVDTTRQAVFTGREIYSHLARRRPYVLWNERASIGVVADREDAAETTPPPLEILQRLFGCDSEEIDFILRPLAETGAEAIGSMGDDAPLAPLSGRQRLLSDFFRQRFAQVTNPPLDSVRERLVMSLRTTIGRKPRGREGSPARVAVLASPILSRAGVTALDSTPLEPVTLETTFDASGDSPAFDCAAALERLASRAVEEVRKGAAVVVLSDRSADRSRAPIPSVLAVAVVYRRLLAEGLGTSASLIVESGELRDPHQIAVACALGATAVVPYVAMATIEAIAGADGAARYRQGVERALLKILAKMGVATIGAYVGSHLVETMGLRASLSFQYFRDVPAIPGRVTLEDIVGTVIDRHRAAFAEPRTPAAISGLHRFRRDGEFHAFNPDVVRALHRASTGGSEAYVHFAQLVDSRAPMTVRDLISFVPGTPIAIDEVEGVEAICRRFFASAMSIGALGPEAHRTIAQAMHLVGGRSNSGEGGEESERAWPPRGGASTNSLVKQVASGRFGVTPAYLLSADELQIKIAQGAKPGEGGQLPAEKVVDHIARLRHVSPGTPLVSPPPHHDIYSIEDLAQLIFDLQTVHPAARIGVKLVAGAGVGVISAGVAKAGAHAIQISGYDGGTGAAPRSSIKHTGWPWEVGLLDAHVVLSQSGLRPDVVLQVDGGLKTGLDVAKAAALGADEFGFGTSLVVAAGCVMARQCHSNTCPVGIATQRKELRSKFQATPDQIANYLWLVAGHVRQILAGLGLKTLGDLVGRLDLVEAGSGSTPHGINAVRLLSQARGSLESPAAPRRSAHDRHTPPDLNARLLDACLPRLGRLPIALRTSISNADRSVGAGLAGIIASRYGDRGSPHAIALDFHGTAGQSFGAFLLPGMSLALSGDANDGVGKGMHGGRIVVRYAGTSAFAERSLREQLRRDDIRIGNGALYGATGGELFVAGAAGDRFGVRNSGAVAVVEGLGDHGCEYMTAGLVIVLGPIGRNFGAGMTGGLACVMGDRGSIESRVHAESAVIEIDDADWQVLATWIDRHARLTGSEAAAAWLRQWRDGGVDMMRESMFVVLPASALAAERRPAMREPVPA